MLKTFSPSDLADLLPRLGPRALARLALHRLALRAGLPQRRLRHRPAIAGPWFGTHLPAAPLLPAGHRAMVLAAAAAVPERPDWHGSFPGGVAALGLDLVAHGDIRPVWERNRWAELPLLVQAARLAPEAGYLARAEEFLADWAAANPPFRGPNWACGQEAALRALHFALALGLVGQAPGPAARAMLEQHGHRIAATPLYALAQDNNHPVTEAAGLWVCGRLAAVPAWEAAGARRLAAALSRLLAPDGSFAQLSTGYHRLLLDVLAIAVWLGLPLAPATRRRLAAAVEWLRPLVAPGTGAMPRLGHQDDACFADLGRGGPGDARPSLERAARLLAGGSAGWSEEPGCRWLNLPPPPPLRPSVVMAGRHGGVRGWVVGPARGFLRIGPLRFRPGHADLLHFELWDGDRPILIDGGTGQYNPVVEALAGIMGHNTIAFDGAEPMPRLGRFLYGRWPAAGALPDGGWSRDRRGYRQARRIWPNGPRGWVVEDAVSGAFRTLALRWRLGPGAWQAGPHGVVGDGARISLASDASLRIALIQGWHSPAYGRVEPAPVLIAEAARPVRWLRTEIALPPSQKYP